MVKVWLVLLIAQLCGFAGGPTQAAVQATPMEITVVTTAPNQSISLPIFGNVNAVQISWSAVPGDTTGPLSSAGFVSHTFPAAGSYTIKIGGVSFTQFGNGNSYPGVQYITGVSTFGTVGLKVLNGAFMGATALTSLPATLPTGVTSLKNMLNGASSFNQSVSGWATSTVTDMSGLFAGASSFNQNLSTWVTSNVSDFSFMFSGARAFNNGDSTNFALSSLSTVGTKWSLARATNLASMFAGATSFNQAVANWDVSQATNLSSMFSGASKFKQSISAWKPHSATNVSGFFGGGSWNTRTYDAILNAWSTDALNPKGLTFDAGGSTYSSAASAAVAILTGSGAGNLGWTILDAGQITTKVSRTLTWQARPNDIMGLIDSFPTLVALDSEGGKTFRYSVDAGSSAVCSVNSSTGVISVIDVGDCTYTASIAADAYALAATLTATTVIKPVTPSEPRLVSAQVSGRDITVKWTIPANTGGTGVQSYSATASAGGSDFVCTTLAPSLTCTIRGVSRGENGYTYSVTTRSVGKAFRTDPLLVSIASTAVSAVVDPPLSRTANWATQPASLIDFGPIGSISAVDSLGVATATYSIDPTSAKVCSVDPTSGALTALRSGNCNYIATVAADPDRRMATATGVVKIRPFTPGPPVISSTTVDGRNITVNFAPPSYDGGYDLGSYAFTASTLVNSFTCEVAAPATSCTIYDTSRGEMGFDYSVSGVTHGADFNGQPGLVSAQSDSVPAHVDAPLTTELAWQSIPNSIEPYGPLAALTAVETNALGNIAYSVADSSAAVCSVSSASGDVTILRAGDCSYRADIARTPDLFASSVTGQTHIAAIAPSKPLNVATSVAARKVTISWDAPANDGGVGLVDYLATIEGGGRTYSCHVLVPVQTCSISDVDRGQSGVAYSATVTATNAPFDTETGLTSEPSAAAIAQVDPPVLRNLSWQSKPGSDVRLGALTALTLSGDLNGDAPVYSVRFDSQAVCRVDANTGAMTALRAGFCNFSATVPADPDFYLGTIDGSTLISPVAPTPPQNVTTQVDGRNITISWDAPSADGGNGILSYHVSLGSSGQSYGCDVQAPDTSCVISGVTRGMHGVTYRASVVATGQPFLLQGSLDSPSSDVIDAAVAAPTDSIVTLSSAPADSVTFGAMTPLAVTGNTQISAPVFSVAAASNQVCAVDATTGVLTALRVGLCSYSVDIAADADHSATKVSGSTLILAAAPSQPLTVETSTSGRSVKISWSTPDNDGGNGIESYHATLSSPDNTYSCDVVAPTRQCTITGVSRGQYGYNYVARVNATGVAFNGNPQRVSDWSQDAQALVDAPATRGLVWASGPQVIESFGPLLAAQVGGDVAGTSPVYSVDADSVDYCAIDQKTGELKALHAGICSYRVDVAADEDHYAAAVLGTVVIRPVAPSSPRNLQTTVDGRNLTINWSAPVADGGNGISGYNVKVEGGGQVLGCDTIDGQNSCQLSQLDRGPSGITYLVTVRAVGIAFDVSPALVSDWAAPVNAAVAGPAPRALSWTSKPDLATNFGPLTPLALGGDLFGLTPIYQVDAASANICSVDLATGALVAQHAGLCVFSASVLGDSDHQPGQLASSTLIKPTAPAPPENVTTNFDGQKLTVTWRPPAESGGSELAAYVVTARSSAGDVNCRVAVPETSCVITAVVLGAHYEVSVQAVNADVPQAQGVASKPSSASAVDIPAPPVIETPTPTPTPTPTETPTPTPTPIETPAPEPPTDKRGLKAFDPTKDAPAAVAKATLNAVTLVSAAASAAAGAAGAAAGSAGAAGGAAGGAARGGGGEGGRGSDAKEEMKAQQELREMTKAKSAAAEVGAGFERWGDRQPIWQIGLIIALDNPFRRTITTIAPFSPLLSKFFADGAYLRAMLGSFSVILPILAAIFGALGVVSTHGLILPPPVWVLAALAVVGVLDVFAGLVGGLVLSLGLAFSSGISSISDARFLVGLFLIGTGPIFMATAFRQVRRKTVKLFSERWERLTDYFVAPVFTAWACVQIIGVLPALIGLQLALPANAGQSVGIAAGAAMLFRIFGEGLAAGYFPARLERHVPLSLKQPSIRQKVVSLVLRALVFAFVASGFVGFNEYLLIGDIFFILPTALSIWQDRFPSSPLLYQVLPAGLPNLAFGKLLTTLSLTALTLFIGESPELAKLSFVILPVPGMLVSITKLFGRSPKPGDVRWYLRPSMRWFYRIGGAAMFVYVLKLVGFLGE